MAGEGTDGAAGRVVWSAPGRVNLIGDHTDYADGYVLPFAVPMRTRVTVTARRDGVLRVASDHFPDVHEARVADLMPQPTAVQTWASYVEGAAWFVAQQSAPDDAVLRGADIDVSGGVPLGSGLSSSAALVTATLGALSQLVGLHWSPDELALAARTVENDYVGAPVGVMDPWVVGHAQAGHALLLDTRTLHDEALPLPLVLPDAAAADDGEPAVALLVVDSGASHRNADAAYAERVSEVQHAAAALGAPSLRDVVDATDVEHLADPMLRSRARHVVSENQRVLTAAGLLRHGDLRDVGPLLTASHISLRDDYAVSTPELDLLVDAALSAGALGARLTGAGNGGCGLALVEITRADAVRQAVVAALTPRLGHPPRTWFVVAGDGAHREPA